MKFIRVLKANNLEKDIETAMESLRNDSENYFETHITYGILYISAVQELVPELPAMPKEAGDILYNLGYPVSYNPFGSGYYLVADSKISYDQFNKKLDDIDYILNVDKI